VPERLYQLRFEAPPLDVTPKNFLGLARRPDLSIHLGRFVREVGEDVQIKSPADAARYLLERVYVPFEDFNQEEMWVLLLNSKCRVTHEVMIYRGTLNSAPVRVGELFREAVRFGAAAILIAHNHPSGDPEPSPEDIQVTQEIQTAGRLLDIQLLDHVVVGRNSYSSLKERGIGL
jgi:DNA repair protein RadC